MTGFSANWLALREPFDHAARSSALTGGIADAMRATGVAPGEYLIADLATGTGSNVRYLRPRLPAPQRWRLVDEDASLLAMAMASLDPLCGRDALEGYEADLSSLDGASLVDGCALVTASALLDLASEAWIIRIARECHRVCAYALFALSYDGRIECMPADEDDGVVRDIVNRHQATDKGFGPALGPRANEVAARAYSALGYEVQRERSDWRLDPGATDVQHRLIDGWGTAAIEIAPDGADRIRAWRERRHAHVDAGVSRMIVGHEDLAAWLR